MPRSAPRNIADLLRAAADSRPTHLGLVAGARRLTWREVDDLTDAVANALLDRGIAPGDRVALMQGNTPEFVVSYLGALRAGATVVPLNTAFTTAEVEALLTDSGTTLLLAQDSTREVARSAGITVGAEVLVVGSPLWTRMMRDAPSGRVESVGGGEDIALLLFTAGTSGRPKGAMLSHRALLADLEMLRALQEPAAVTPDDVALVVLPLFHVYGLNAVLGLALTEGVTCVLLDRFDAVESLALIRDEGVTTVVGAPPMMAAWVRVEGAAGALEGVRMLVSGGAPLPAELAARVESVLGLPVWEGYGLTEAAPVVTSTLVRGRPRPGSVGTALPGLELRLVDAGEDVDDGDPGEIWIRGASLFSGYWPDGAGGPDGDGWFNTGDVAYADDDGELHLVDHRRDLILVSGFNVYPREIERVIDAMPDVAESAVVGIRDERTGEAVKALVVAAPGTEVSPAAVRAWCEQRLARFKCPTVVEVVDRLPHSATGKVAKGRLREVYGA